MLMQRQQGHHTSENACSSFPFHGVAGRLVRMVLTVGLGFIFDYFGMELARFSREVAIVWPSAGMGFALALLWGKEVIPAFFLGELLLALQINPPLTALGRCGAIMAGRYLGWYLVHRFGHFAGVLSTRTMVTFILGGCLVNAVVAATGGAATLLLMGNIATEFAGSIWWTWFLGDVVAILAISPMILSWCLLGFQGLEKDYHEPALILAGMLGVALFFFSKETAQALGNYPVAFTMIPFLLWSAFRLGHRELYSFLFLVTCLGVWGTIAGVGPFAMHEPKTALLLMQVYMGTMISMTLVMHAVIKERERAMESLERSQDASIFSLANLAEVRDNETGAHIMRTRFYVKALAERLQKNVVYRDRLDQRTIEMIYKTAPLHDIGKVGVPDSILHKPGRLSDVEFEEIKRHPELGSETLRETMKILGTSNFMRIADETVSAHHERWDGTGYPNGLKGEGIPLPARLMAVADVYDALISKRCYKPAMTHEEARDIIVEGKGTHFDPHVVDAFLREEGEFQRIARRYSDDSYDHQRLTAGLESA